MLMHDLCLLHIVCMLAAYGLQARMPLRNVVLVLSVMLCGESLKKVHVPGNPCSAQSCHLLSQHDPLALRAYCCVTKVLEPNKPSAAALRHRVHCSSTAPPLIYLHLTPADCFSLLLVPGFISKLKFWYFFFFFCSLFFFNKVWYFKKEMIQQQKHSNSFLFCSHFRFLYHCISFLPVVKVNHDIWENVSYRQLQQSARCRVVLCRTVWKT